MIKRILKFLKPSNVHKRFCVSKKMKPYCNEVLINLKRVGFRNIKAYSKLTWKYYGKDRVRFTYKATRDSKMWLIKIAKGFDEKMSNSIAFQSRFNDIFNFIPKGSELIIDGYKCYFTEYIESINFSFSLKKADKKNLDSYLTQVNNILDELDKYKIVHCDLEEVNILVENKSNRIYLIDWDTVVSGPSGLYCNAFPDFTIKMHIDNRAIYDDAYSFCILFKRYVKPETLNNSSLYKNIENKVGRNTHVTSE